MTSTFPPPPPPPASSLPWWRSTTAKIIGAVFAALVVVGALSSPEDTATKQVAADTDADTGDGVATTEATATTTTTEATTTTTEEATTTTTAPPPSDSDLVYDWYLDYGHLVENMPVVFESIAVAADNFDVTGMSAACADLAILVDEARAAPGVPVAAINDPWQEALAYFDEAAVRCITGATAFDVDEIEAATAALISGTEALNRATAATDALL